MRNYDGLFVFLMERAGDYISTNNGLMDGLTPTGFARFLSQYLVDNELEICEYGVEDKDVPKETTEERRKRNDRAVEDYLRRFRSPTSLGLMEVSDMITKPQEKPVKKKE